MTELELESEILEIVDIQQTPDGMSRGDLQGVVEALVAKVKREGIE